MAAPVLPAVTMAWARPSLTSSAQRRIDERRFLRIGVIAGSSMPDHLLGVDDLDAVARPAAEASQLGARSARSSPTSRIDTPSSAAARNAPSTAARGAKSPPMASTAIGMLGVPGAGLEIEVGPAARAAGSGSAGILAEGEGRNPGAGSA